MPGPANVVVVGQLARDVVLLVDRVPEPGSAADVRQRRETLGGKGANQAVALAQLGVPVTLVAISGDDRAADEILDRAHRDGIDLTHVFRRPGVTTGLVVEALDADGQWRYLQDLPPEVQLTVPDVDAAAQALRTAGAVIVQLQQPAPATVAAARLAREGSALVVLDGLPDEVSREELLACADVVRADNHESATLVGAAEGDVDGLRAGGRELVERHHPCIVVLGAGAAGNLVVWRSDDDAVEDELIPLTDEHVVDTTGAGDVLVAALTAALLRGDPPPVAARLGVLAAGVTVTHQGGRPQLTPDVLDRPVQAPT